MAEKSTFGVSPEQFGLAIMVASVLTLAEASGASLVAKSWLPLLMTTGVSAVLVWQYMDAINNPHSQVMPINSAQNANAPAGA